MPSNNNGSPTHEIVRTFFKLFFHLLYHQFAWIYDWIAAFVSLGNWKSWTNCVLPYLDSQMVLELGCGPGHLQYALTQKGINPFGIDASSQMASLASERLCKYSLPANIILGLAQYLPYPDRHFDQIVATFPSEYISDKKTLRQAWRVLKNSGELIIMPVAWITGEKWWYKLAAWLFRITGQAPSLDPGAYEDGIIFPLTFLEEIGFQVSSQIVHLDTSKVLLIRAAKEIPDDR